MTAAASSSTGSAGRRKRTSLSELKRLPWRRALFLAVNIASAVLTLVTGLRENPVLVFVTGRYDYVRTRLKEGRINYNMVRDDLIDVDKLPNLTVVGESFRFFTAPTRSPENLGEDRSTCMRVNSMNVTINNLNFDDFWGRGPRRGQMFLYSMSAPRCDVVNFKPEWVADCVRSRNNSERECHRYILDNFDALMANRVVQMGVEVDFGAPGLPFLRCLGRPDCAFTYMTDLMVQQRFWAGGSYHIEIQSSKCHAVPRLLNDDLRYGLFQTQPYDQKAAVVAAIDNRGWFASVVTVTYGVVALALIARGIINTIFRTKAVFYVPSKLRFTGPLRRYARFFVPFMALSTLTAEDESAVIRFKGKTIMASDVWINHWLYILLSILDALVSLRMTYTVFEMGTWMLTKKANIENFIFTASALTRITWLMCLLHTVLRLAIKGVTRSLRALKVLRPELRRRIDRYADMSAVFLSYKAYSLLLCLLLCLFLTIHGSTTFMVHAEPYKVAVYGGELELANFWGNEIICDFVVILSMLTLMGGLFGAFMMRTPFRYAANNGLLRLLQQRYVFVGWDALSVMDALGIDPFDAKLLEDDADEDDSERSVPVRCSIGTVLQQLYQSGPSGFVVLAADYLFHDGGFSLPPVEFRFQTKKALAMGLLRSFQSAATAGTTGQYSSTRPSTKRSRYAVIAALDASDDASKATMTKFDSVKLEGDGEGEGGAHQAPVAKGEPKAYRSLFERELRVFAEKTYGRVLLVDEGTPGKYGKNAAGVMEYAVTDALSSMNILDIRHLLGSSKKLTIR